MADVTALQARLAAAETAYDQLMRGQQVAEIAHGADKMTFSSGQIGKLSAYIADLKGQLRRLGVEVHGGRGRSRAVFF